MREKFNRNMQMTSEAARKLAEQTVGFRVPPSALISTKILSDVICRPFVVSNCLDPEGSRTS